MRAQDFNRTNPAVFAGSAFVFGVVAGVFLKDFLKDAGKWLYKRARPGLWRHAHELTVSYDETFQTRSAGENRLRRRVTGTIPESSS
jgi:hypothetical protein